MAFGVDGGTVEWVCRRGLGYAVHIVDQSMSLFRFLLEDQFLFSFDLLQKTRIKTFEPFLVYVLVIFRLSYLC